MKPWLRKFYARLPVVKELQQINGALTSAKVALINNFIHNHINTLPRYADRRKLNHYEHQVFSQNGEDGILAEIFRRVGTRSRFFVEFGVGDGLETNTTFLLTQGWRGCWLEADRPSITAIQSQFRRTLAEGKLKLRQTFITAENISSIFSEMEIPVEFDLLSLDIDRNTYHVWKALDRFKPRVVVIEYNATFPGEAEWVAEYEPARTWNNSSYFGASLKSYERLGASLGYTLVGCELSGTNAFFVRNTEQLDLFSDPFTSENHYEPARLWLARREAHMRCFDDRIA